MKKKTAIISIVVIVLIGVAYFAYLYNCEDDWCLKYEWQKVRITNSFEECVSRGFDTSEGEIKECRAGDKIFREEINYEEAKREKIEISADSEDMMKLSVYFGSKMFDPSSEKCERSYPVDRNVPKTLAVGGAALAELFRGTTEEENNRGYFTSINDGVSLKSLSIKDGIATADFDAKINEGVGGSCKVAQIRSQIENTLKQFPTVRGVVITVNGKSEEVLQP